MVAHAQSSTTTEEVPLERGRARTLRYVVPVGRALFSAIFVMSGLSNFAPSTIGYAASHGVPMAGLLVPLAGVLAVVGGLSILLGWKTRYGALAVVLFLVPVTLMMHNFWSVPDPQAAMHERVNFMKNVSIIGGALLLMYFGGGPLSLDARRRSTRRMARPV